MTLARIACGSCGRLFMTEQPATMLPALTGACACGGRFSAAGSVPASSVGRERRD